MLRLCFFLVVAMSASSVAHGLAPLTAKSGWVAEGARSCVFDGSLKSELCVQYRRVIVHSIGTREWREERYRWRALNGAEVYYRSRLGIVGISTFTKGVLFDPNSKFPGHRSSDAVSYSPSREELIIGVPADGYEFSVSR